MKPAALHGLCTAVSREAWATLPESSSRPLLATLAQSCNLAHASLETAVVRLKEANNHQMADPVQDS